jgi:hypothetical protein
LPSAQRPRVSSEVDVMSLSRFHQLIGIILVSSASMASLGLTTTVCGEDVTEPTWTVMIYMAADAEPALPWEEDLNEMEAAELTDWMNVVVLVDPLGDGDSVIYEIAPDGGADLDITSPVVDDSEEVIPPSGEVDTASPSTLSDFITFTWRNYPADRLALVLWGHSAGWYGLCADGLNAMDMPDLGLAFDSATSELERSIDIVIADSCTEGVAETMFELMGHADWFVGSEIAVPAQGLPYDRVLDALAEDRWVSPEDWGAEICEIHRMNLLLNSWSATLAVNDLSALDGFAESIGALATYVEGYADLYRHTFEAVMSEAANSDLTEWYVDAGDMLRTLMAAELPTEIAFLALDALTAYDDLVEHFASYPSPYDGNFDNVSDCSGVAIYCPGDDPYDISYWDTSFSESGWGDATSAVRADEPETPNGPAPTVTYADTDEDGHMDEATIHWGSPHDRLSAWVSADTQAGLQLLDVIESAGQDIVVSGLLGDLRVSASAWDGGVVASQHDLEVSLEGQFEVRALIVSNDGGVPEAIDVVVLTRLGEVQLLPSNGAFVGQIAIPDDAGYGDLLTVEVRGNGGEVLSWNRTFVQGTSATVVVLLSADDDGGPGEAFIIPAMVLIACAALITLILRNRRGPGAKV